MIQVMTPMHRMVMMQQLDAAAPEIDDGNLHEIGRLDIFEHSLSNLLPWYANNNPSFLFKNVVLV